MLLATMLIGGSVRRHGPKNSTRFFHMYTILLCVFVFSSNYLLNIKVKIYIWLNVFFIYFFAHDNNPVPAMTKHILTSKSRCPGSLEDSRQVCCSSSFQDGDPAGAELNTPDLEVISG